MSTYEKITSIVIAVTLLAILMFSYHEITEPADDGDRGPSFTESIGEDFAMGTFTTTLNRHASASVEENCRALEPVLIATLHDIDEHLEELGVYKQGRFEINQETLDILCHTEATLTFTNDRGEKLLLEKLPFKRKIPTNGSAADVGTDIRINATVILPGTVPPGTPTTYGEVLIPDRYLDLD